MRIPRTRALIAAALAVVLAACALERPTASKAPTQRTNATQPSALLGLTIGLLSCPTSGYGSVTQTIGSAGGVIKVGPHSLSIPAGALSAPVTITATAPAGNYAEVKFEPQGLQFARPAAVTLSYRSCGLLGVLDALSVAYIDDNFNILQILPSLPNIFNETVTAPINHFSGYALAF